MLVKKETSAARSVVLRMYDIWVIPLFLLREVEYTDSAELEACAMSEETDVACLVEHAWVVLVVNRVGVVVAAIGGYIMSLASFLDVAIYDDFAIHGNGDVVALNTDFLFAPLAQRLMLDTLGGDNTIN